MLYKFFWTRTKNRVIENRVMENRVKRGITVTDDSVLHTEAAFGPPCKTSTMGATFMKAKTDNVKEVPCGPAPRNFPPKSNVMNLSK